MATISTVMRLQDQFTHIISRSTAEMGRMVEGMEKINRAERSLDMSYTFTDIRRDISLTSHALDEFSGELGKVSGHKQSVNFLESGFKKLGGAIVVANQGLGLISKVVNSLDEFGSASTARVSADARLKLINDGLRTQAQLEAQVMQVANETRSEYEATAGLVANMGRQDYFKGNNDMALDFVETLNKGMLLSGATAAESQSVLLQLSQGLSSGVLRGEEFNSIMENGSVIAEMMAASLGVTQEELQAMAQEEQLTTETVVSSIMAQSAAIEAQFAQMPATYDQVRTSLGNITSQIMDGLTSPGGGIDVLVSKLQAMDTWLKSAAGAKVLEDVTDGITAVISSVMWLAEMAAYAAAAIYDNWGILEPVFIVLAAAVGALTIAWLVHKAVQTANAAATGISAAVTLVQALATGKAAEAQWGLNASLLACPLTWIVVAIGAAIAAMVALGVCIYRLWQTNIDFRVAFLSEWNKVLSFADNFPVFFLGIGYGIADAFSIAKEFVFNTLEDMVNGAIERINRLITLANMIPGVSISTVDAVTFGTENAIAEQAKRAERSAKLAEAQAAAAQKAVDRENQLQEDASNWRAEAAAEEQAASEEERNAMSDWIEGESTPAVKVAGGEVGIAAESLEYLNDIAELRVLNEISSGSSLRLSREDTELMQASANSSSNIYYINYTGGVKVNANVRKGENWDDIRAQLEQESQNEIDAGISDLEEVVFG